MEAFDEFERIIEQQPDLDELDTQDEDDGPGERVEVEEWSDINGVTDRISNQERETVAALINEDQVGDDEVVIWLPGFITDKDLEAVTGCEQLYTVAIEDYSDEAWAASQDGSEPEYVPKSWTVIFDPVNTNPIESQQQSLAGWA